MTIDQRLIQIPEQSPIQRQTGLPYPRLRAAFNPEKHTEIQVQDKVKVFDTASRVLETIAGISGYYASEKNYTQHPGIYLESNFDDMRNMISGLSYLADLADIRFYGKKGSLGRVARYILEDLEDPKAIELSRNLFPSLPGDVRTYNPLTADSPTLPNGPETVSESQSKKATIPSRLKEEVMGFIGKNQAFILDPGSVDDDTVREKLFSTLQQYTIASVERDMLNGRAYFEGSLGVKSVKLSGKTEFINIEGEKDENKEKPYKNPLDSLVENLQSFGHELKTPFTGLTLQQQYYERRARKGLVTEEYQQQFVEDMYYAWRKLYRYTVEQAHVIQGEKPLNLRAKSFVNMLSDSLQDYARIYKRGAFPVLKFSVHEVNTLSRNLETTNSTLGLLARHIISDAQNVLMNFPSEDAKKLTDASKIEIVAQTVFESEGTPFLKVTIRDRIQGFPPRLADRGEYDGYHEYQNEFANTFSTGIGGVALQERLRDQGCKFKIGNYEFTRNDGSIGTGAFTEITIPLY